MIIEDKNIDGGKGFETSCRIWGIESAKMTGTIIEEDKGANNL